MIFFILIQNDFFLYLNLILPLNINTVFFLNFFLLSPFHSLNSTKLEIFLQIYLTLFKTEQKSGKKRKIGNLQKIKLKPLRSKSKFQLLDEFQKYQEAGDSLVSCSVLFVVIGRMALKRER